MNVSFYTLSIKGKRYDICGSEVFAAAMFKACKLENVIHLNDAIWKFVKIGTLRHFSSVDYFDNKTSKHAIAEWNIS